MLSIILMIGGRPALVTATVLSFFGLTGGCGMLTILFAFFSLQEKRKIGTKRIKYKKVGILFMDDMAYWLAQQISDSFIYQTDKKMNFSLIGNLK